MDAEQTFHSRVQTLADLEDGREEVSIHPSEFVAWKGCTPIAQSFLSGRAGRKDGCCSREIYVQSHLVHIQLGTFAKRQQLEIQDVGQ